MDLMVKVRKRKIRNKEYYYIEHSLKIKDKVRKKEKYLGTNIPEDIEYIKSEFFKEVFKEKWLKKLETIKDRFSKEFRSMPASAKEKYIKNFMIKFTYDTNRIEGNTLTLKETAKLLEEGIAPKGKLLDDIKETESHKRVFYEMLNYKKDLNLNLVLDWHKELFKGTKPDVAGIIRKYSVGVARSKVEFPLYSVLDTLLKEFFKWYKEERGKLHPVELAALAHLKFVTIHPFGDGNGRISRLIMNFILNKHKYPMLDIKYLNRDRYYNALERSQLTGDEYIFVQFIVRRYLKEYKNYF